MSGVYLVVHDSSETHDTHMDVIFLTDKSRILQSSTTWQCVGTSHQSWAKRKPNLVRDQIICRDFSGFLHFLPNGVSSCAGSRWRRRGEAAVAMEILYRSTPGWVNRWHLSTRFRLLSIKPDDKQARVNLCHIIQSVTVKHIVTGILFQTCWTSKKIKLNKMFLHHSTLTLEVKTLFYETPN